MNVASHSDDIASPPVEAEPKRLGLMHKGGSALITSDLAWEFPAWEEILRQCLTRYRYAPDYWEGKLIVHIPADYDDLVGRIEGLGELELFGDRVRTVTLVGNPFNFGENKKMRSEHKFSDNQATVVILTNEFFKYVGKWTLASALDTALAQFAHTPMTGSDWDGFAAYLEQYGLYRTSFDEVVLFKPANLAEPTTGSDASDFRFFEATTYPTRKA